MLGYTNALDFQGINQWVYGRIYDPSLHQDPAISGGDWINFIFRDLTVNPDNTLTWANITGVESIRIYAFDNASETNPANAVSTATMPREHNAYLTFQLHEEVSFDLSEMSPALTEDGTYYIRIQAITPEFPVRGQEPLIWGENSPISEPAQVAGQAAREGQRHFSMTLDSTEIVDRISGATTQMDVAPIIQEGRTLVPVRFVAESLGGSAEWNEADSEVTVTVDGIELTFAIGQMVDGMDVPAQIIDGRTMVPLRFIVEYFGAEVSFDEATRVIEIIR